MKGVSRWATAAGLALVLAAPAAQAGLFDDDEARKAILDLRQRLEQSNEASRQQLTEQMRQMSEQLSQMKRSMLELSNQIEALRAENAKLRGQDETLARDLADVQRKQRDIQHGVEDRVRKLEPQKVLVDGKEFLADPDEKRLFDEAMAVMRKGDYAQASVMLQALKGRYPATGYNESLLFWLGNAQYGKGEYKEALASFRALLAAAPQHARAAESMLSIANCQMELKDAKAAKRTLDDLIKTYPNSDAAQAGKERLAARK
jgi:tol-pal system protein YbgF